MRATKLFSASTIGSLLRSTRSRSSQRAWHKNNTDTRLQDAPLLGVTQNFIRLAKRNVIASNNQILKLRHYFSDTCFGICSEIDVTAPNKTWPWDCARVQRNENASMWKQRRPTEQLASQNSIRCDRNTTKAICVLDFMHILHSGAWATHANSGHHNSRRQAIPRLHTLTKVRRGL